MKRRVSGSPGPKNTIVIAYGRNKDKYAVKSRVGCKSVNGRKIPIDGPTIGHIIDGAYIANKDLPGMKHSECDYRSGPMCSSAAIFHRISWRI